MEVADWASLQVQHHAGRWLCDECRFLQVRGIRTRSQVAVELERVYVSLALNRPATKKEEAEARVREMLERGAEGEAPSEPLPRLEREAPEPERLSVGESLQRCPQRLVILGGPGTGKTTLLNYLALKFARGQAEDELGLDERRLPILIPLRELSRLKLPLTAENLPTLCTSPEMAETCPSGFFRDRLMAGDCLVLLDGMDEVTDQAERRRVAKGIDDLMNNYRGNRYVVTSRPLGYRGVALSGCAEFEICDFTDDDVEEFARGWCLGVELGIRGVERAVSEVVARRRAEREADALIAAIRANEHVRRLTVNPLLLTIVAMVHRYRATLPSRRVELYDECVQVLLGYWDEAKGIAGQLDWERKRAVLRPLAHWMHERGLRETERRDVERVIGDALPSVGESPASAGEFLVEVRARSGLLVERGLGLYGFSHLTFQEYLTASTLSDRGEAGREELLEHRRDPWWAEVILLYAGMAEGQAAALIQALLAEREDLFKSDLFLAARCLIDVPSIEPRLAESLLSQLMDELRAGEFVGLRDAAAVALGQLGGSVVAPLAAAVLLPLLSNDDADLRGRAADALGRIGRSEPGVIDALRPLLSDEDSSVQWRAAHALGRIEWTEPGTIDVLLDLLSKLEVMYRRGLILDAEALATIGRAEPGFIDALLPLLSDEDADVRRRAAYALRAFGRAEPGVIDALLPLLSDEDLYVRWRAVEALATIGRAEPGVIDALLPLLSDEDSSVRGHAAEALGTIGRAEPRVIDALLPLLSHEDSYVRRLAADALGTIGRAEPGVIDALLPLLSDEDLYVREVAADALGTIGRAEPRVIDALLPLLSDKNLYVRANAAYVLGTIGRAEPRVIDALLPLLSDEDASVRRLAAFALGTIGRAEPRVIDALLPLLSDEDSDVRRRAADALRTIGRAEPGVIDALLPLLSDDSEVVPGATAQALDPTHHEGIQVPPECVPSLLALLDSSQVVEYPFPGMKRTIKDLAWLLLREYHRQTHQPVYRQP